MHTIPHHPWQKVGTDLFEWKGKAHLIVVDYYSRYPEVAELRNTKARTVISKTKSIFTAFPTSSYQTIDLNIPHKNTSNSRKITTLPYNDKPEIALVWWSTRENRTDCKEHFGKMSSTQPRSLFGTPRL
jgi:hypothetical protein